MKTESIQDQSSVTDEIPLCPVFGVCGGCAYQDLSYPEELRIKENFLRAELQEKLDLDDSIFQPAVASPDPYHYRSRLDLTLRKFKSGDLLLGFQVEAGRRIIPVESCAIARREISDFIPELKRQAAIKLPENYKIANLVVKTGDDGRVLWGGIGRRSLVLRNQDYLWTEIHGKRIFYSLDTFFQANLSILPLLMEKIQDFVELDHRTTFFDLYAGVGLFGIYFADQVKRMVMIEECSSSFKLMQFNVAYHKLDRAEICSGKVESELLPRLRARAPGKCIAIVDPPRRGLSTDALATLAEAKSLAALLYLSCHPESLSRDLAALKQKGWSIQTVIPFDFFPKTKHLETLVLLKP